MPSLILASSSPRRRRLLRAGGFKFDTVPPLIAENSDLYLSGGELTALNARRKGISVAHRYPEKVVLAVDTLVWLEGRIIGKPADKSDANRILKRLSGKTHQVFSSVFIVHLATRRMKLFSEMSHVRFRELSDSQISDYLDKIRPMDKAGAYAAQGHGAEIIRQIKGSYSNVVGLPMERTMPALESFEIRSQRPVSRSSPSRAEPVWSRAAARDEEPDKETRR